jgi:hypothetical protein
MVLGASPAANRDVVMVNRRPLRRITDRRYLTGHFGCNKFAASVRLTLDCGHETIRKASKEPRRKAHCWVCPLEEVS